VTACPVAGYDVRVLPATHAGPEVGPAVLYDLTGPDGARLLWATDTGVLGPRALQLVADRRYDAVLLDLTSAHQAGAPRPGQLAGADRELRRRGRVVATHGRARDPPRPRQPAAGLELDAVLAGWGASATAGR
jgi:adenosylcobinamide kinase/adenosylcobinamide-phosphate guanylyltransferase